MIRGEILSGNRKPGERIPSVLQLNEQFGIANVTAQKVMTALRADGLIYTEPGMGSFVRDQSEEGERA
ncbi:hypothetical protein Psi02_59560 [Planotetraspora silvatica]|uniref:HTH gntR-type domain-containing protein n=2 Tax=Planotetraspora silvatica TaxID=234614 RepID=A0A8J3UQR8_9ACTN|nr:hypothetical protein Psi02_59560 [Planotetraspora silvatica]